MPNNEEAENAVVAQDFQELEVLRREVVENDTTIQRVGQFLEQRGTFSLDENEKYIAEVLKDVQQMRLCFQREYESPEVNPEELREQGFRLLELSQEMHHKLEVVSVLIKDKTRQRSLEVLGNLLEGSSEIRDIIPGVMDAFTSSNNTSEVPTHLKNWSKTTGVMHTFLTDAAFKTPGIEEDIIGSIKTLLARFRDLHSPNWYFDFVEVVSDGSLEKVRDFQDTLESYQTELGNLTKEVEHVCGYN